MEAEIGEWSGRLGRKVLKDDDKLEEEIRRIVPPGRHGRDRQEARSDAGHQPAGAE
jgi:hypothetical protein